MDDNSSASSDAPSQPSSVTTKMESTDRSSSGSSFSLARSESKAVQKTKNILFVVLVSSALIVTGLTFYLLSNAEQHDFDSKFHDFAVEISELVHHEANSIFLAVEALSLAVTSFVTTSKSSWPLVSMPHFEIRGGKSNELCNSLLTAFSPVVFNTTRLEWESYSVKNQGWIQEGVDFNIDLHQAFINGTFEAAPISKQIFRYENGKSVVENDIGPYLPVWQLAPAPHDVSIVNLNLLSHPVFSRVYHGMLKTNNHVLSEVLPLDFLYGGSIHHVNNPHSFLFQPVYKGFNEEHREEEDIAGVIISILPWDHYFTNLLPNDVNGITVVLRGTCNQTFTYMINGKEAIYIGPGDLHDPNYDYLFFETDFDVYHHFNVSLTKEHCEFGLSIYPTKRLEEAHKTKKPFLFSLAVFLVFSFTSMVFIMYDKLVQKRQAKVMGAAKRSDAIVSSIFPSNVRDRIMKEAEEQDQGPTQKRFGLAKTQLKSFLEGAVEDSENVFNSKPIADLFPSATVMFADIVGFTAWSSVREPSQVFQLLETLYHGFDEVARHRRVFKVETIGDCYVAVTGLPEPRHDHAVVMTRFARDVLSRTNDLAKKLEVRLGPDTGDLCMRIGMNSGPVTAGVLRGEKARFQLFGDTVNTASRMESTGERNRIHISQETADFLRAAGKSHWLFQREETVFAKGKGELQTYWVGLKLQSSPSLHSGTATTSSSDEYAVNLPMSSERKEVQKLSKQAINGSGDKECIAEQGRGASLTEGMQKPIISDKVERLVSWNTDVMVKLLKQMVARRNASRRSDASPSVIPPTFHPETGTTVLDEVEEIIELPRFDARAVSMQECPENIELDPNVTTQLHDYITIVATLYRDNPFHNFEHASHVTMSVTKLLSRIVAPDDILDDDDDGTDGSLGHFDRNLHDHTYGITSDPLTQFAVVFSALIHDVDHSGVPNAQLVKENSVIAGIYNNKSVAEQNSVDIAWGLLMDDTFKDLRSVIYTNQCELNRFRQLIVNAVMATDIVDKELKDLRNARWDKAFNSKDLSHTQCQEKDVNRKATIVIEHLIQASDVAHTMQHWHIYRKWNERFFQEMYHAYKVGRAEKDPSEFWYKGEIGFFDFYIIPLAKKLRDCGVFGVSCDEYLNYAMANRKEWEIKGQEVVAGMIAKYKEEEFSYCAEQCKLGD